MKRNTEKPSNILDRALTDIRNTPIDANQVEQAATRVMAMLTAEHNKVVLHPSAAEGHAGDRIQSCADFQSLIPAYRSSSLTASRKILLEDHVRDCLECRKVLHPAARTVPAPARRRQKAGGLRWIAVAAVLLITVGVLGRNAIRDFVFPIDVHATAQAVNGNLFRVSGQDVLPVGAGERIDRHQSVRTGSNSGAVLELADGSRIEMNSRSELSLDRANDGVNINLARGSVIVTAAKQRNGHLYVATPDCTVSVVGTVFSVSSGAKGSRVSVIEGEVHVRQGSATQAIRPGQQVATNTAMGQVPVQDEIAWSRDRDLHIAMLKQFVAFSEDLGNRIGRQPMRYRSNLLALVPANTRVFASLPNVTQPVSESYAALKQRISENPALQQWWTANQTQGKGISIDEMVRRLTQAGSQLGPEIILALPKDIADGSPVLLSETPKPEELVSAILELAGADASIRLVRNTAELSQASGAKDSLIVYIEQNVVIAASNARQIAKALGSANGFAGSPLYPRVIQAYNEGVGWLLAADLHQLIGESRSAPDALGIGNVAQLVIEQKTGSNAAYQAVLGFNQARTGAAAWLGSPGPIGAAEFVSANAYGAAAIVTKDPALILDDIFSILPAGGRLAIQDFQNQHHVDLRYDLAAPLGNEFLLAIDGPILPAPSWKVVVEVNDAARMQNTLRRAIDEFNSEAALNKNGQIASGTEVIGGRTFYSLTSKDFPVEIHYTFWSGYMILAPRRVLLEEAMRYRDSGDNLARSDRFRAQLPSDGRDNASGFMYQNLQSGAETIANAMPGSAVADRFKDVVNNALPKVVLLYGEADQIRISSQGVFATNLMSMAGMAGMIQAAGVK